MHIDMPTRYDLERLAAARDPHSVTIYLSTSSVPADSEKNQTKARSLFGSAIKQLQDGGRQGIRRRHRSVSQRTVGGSGVLVRHGPQPGHLRNADVGS